MLRIRIVSADKPKHRPFEDFEEEMRKRCGKFASLSIQHVEVQKFAKLPPAERILKEEGVLLAALDPAEFVVVLDDQGKAYSSEKFADFIKGLALKGHSRVAFVIGGALGLGDSIKRRAGAILSLSSLTFTSQLARAILVEQLYRALTILNGTPYHKE